MTWYEWAAVAWGWFGMLLAVAFRDQVVRVGVRDRWWWYPVVVVIWPGFVLVYIFDKAIARGKFK